MNLRRKKQEGFTLIEVVAVAALLGVLITMLMPSLQGANDKVKDARLKNDLATVDQAISLYKMENGECPADLKDLQPDYLASGSEFKDAANKEFTYTVDSGKLSYTLKGQNTKGEDVTSGGSKAGNS